MTRDEVWMLAGAVALAAAAWLYWKRTAPTMPSTAQPNSYGHYGPGGIFTNPSVR